MSQNNKLITVACTAQPKYGRVLTETVQPSGRVSTNVVVPPLISGVAPSAPKPQAASTAAASKTKGH
jgi:hypothetical protein